MSLIMYNIRSGSSGNCSFVGNEKGGLLVDAGIPCKTIVDELKAANIPLSIIKGVLVTHEHSDHCKSVSSIAKMLDIPVYSTEGTLDAMAMNKSLKLDVEAIGIDPDQSFFASNMEILPFSIPHDAAQPVAYKFFSEGHSVCICTDLGFVPKKVYEVLEGSEVLLFESNHDVDMLQSSTKYPVFLKRRILSRTGHISNELCSENILKLCQSGTKHFLLGHLSRNTNTYELAYNTTRNVLLDKGAEPDIDFSLCCARHDTRSNVYILK